jgi:hypothetical protein
VAPAAHACQCHAPANASTNGSAAAGQPSRERYPVLPDGRPDFGRMDVTQRLAYHRERLGLRF